MFVSQTSLYIWTFQTSLSFKFSRDGSHNCANTLIERKFDFCQLTQSVSSTPFLSTIFLKIAEVLNQKLLCPLPSGVYILRNLSLPGFHSPLPFEMKVCASLNFTLKPKNQKNFGTYLIIKLNITLDRTMWYDEQYDEKDDWILDVTLRDVSKHYINAVR